MPCVGVTAASPGQWRAADGPDGHAMPSGLGKGGGSVNNGGYNVETKQTNKQTKETVGLRHIKKP